MMEMTGGTANTVNRLSSTRLTLVLRSNLAALREVAHRAILIKLHRLCAGHSRVFDLARLEAGETLMQIARTYNVSHMTIARLQPSHAPAE
jgi:hypothetical protein